MQYDNPSHRVSSYTSEPSRDGGGGTELTYTLAQSAIPVSINTASANTIALYGQSAILVTHTIGVLGSYITTALTPGMKFVTDDRTESYLFRGIRKGRASPSGSIPALTYIDVEQIL
jgi:hypothetical protein